MKDDDAYNPRNTKPVPRKRQWSGKPGVTSPLPTELWECIFQFVVEPVTLFALEQVNSLFRSILARDRHPAWTVALENLIRAPSRKMSPHYNYLNDTANTIKPTPRECLRLIMQAHCMHNQCGSFMNVEVYWPFKMRLCFCCVYELTIKRAALEYAYGRDDRLLELPFVYMPMLKDLGDNVLHGRADMHFLVRDVNVMMGHDEVAVGYVFEDFEGEGKNDYMTRKMLLIQKMRQDARADADA